MLNSETDILLILLCEGRKLDLYIGYIYTLLLPQLTAINNAADNVLPLYLLNCKLDKAVINQALNYSRHILVKAAVVDKAYAVISHYLPGRQGVKLPFL